MPLVLIFSHSTTHHPHPPLHVPTFASHISTCINFSSPISVVFLNNQPPRQALFTVSSSYYSIQLLLSLQSGIHWCCHTPSSDQPQELHLRLSLWQLPFSDLPLFICSIPLSIHLCFCCLWENYQKNYLFHSSELFLPPVFESFTCLHHPGTLSFDKLSSKCKNITLFFHFL